MSRWNPVDIVQRALGRRQNGGSTGDAEATAGLRDVLYFDAARAESLYSQIAGGLVREIRSSEETARQDRRIRRYDLKLFKPEFGGIRTEATSRLESKVLHHDLLITLEQYLLDAGLAVDINDSFAEGAPSEEAIHAVLQRSSCVRAEGWAVIEDYERIKEIASRFNSVVEFIGRCSMQQIEKSDEYRALVKKLDEARESAEAEKDGNKRARALSKLQPVEKQLREALQEATGLGGVDEWLLNGMGFFIDTFMPRRINLRVYPFESTPAFQVLSNLKRTSFLDDELENVVFAYGNRPTVKLTVLGIITSLPAAADNRFDPMGEFQDAGSMSEEKEFERGFRGVFGGMEGFNRFARYSRYPNVTVYPLAVYRRLARPDDDGTPDNLR